MVNSEALVLLIITYRVSKAANNQSEKKKKMKNRKHTVLSDLQ